jgi:hypothetical protein
MLSWQRNPISVDTCHANKDPSVVVEAGKGILQLFKICTGERIMLSDVAEIKECQNVFDHLRWYMASDGRKVDLNHQQNIRRQFNIMEISHVPS